MNVEIVRKHKWLFILALVGLAGLFSFYRMGHNDTKALAEFSASYEKLDETISDFYRVIFAANLEDRFATGDLERKADEALVELNTKASARISSLTKNDAELMNTTREIADLSREELNTLKTLKSAVADKNANLDSLAKEFGDVKNKRETAYARFQELAELKE